MIATTRGVIRIGRCSQLPGGSARMWRGCGSPGGWSLAYEIRASTGACVPRPLFGLQEHFPMDSQTNRRSFLFGASVAGFGIFAEGRRGQAAGVGPNATLNIACIG